MREGWGIATRIQLCCCGEARCIRSVLLHHFVVVSHDEERGGPLAYEQRPGILPETLSMAEMAIDPRAKSEEQTGRCHRCAPLNCPRDPIFLYLSSFYSGFHDYLLKGLDHHPFMVSVGHHRVETRVRVLGLGRMNCAVTLFPWLGRCLNASLKCQTPSALSPCDKLKRFEVKDFCALGLASYTDNDSEGMALVEQATCSYSFRPSELSQPNLETKSFTAFAIIGFRKHSVHSLATLFWVVAAI